MTVLLLAGLALGGGALSASPLALFETMQAAYARVEGYTARFVKQERLGDDLRPREQALIKFQRPGRIYLRWVAGAAKGRQILFVAGRDDDRLLLHQPGFPAGFFTVVLAPDSPLVLRESRHPVTDVGIGRLIELLADNARRASVRGELTVVPGRVEIAGRRTRWVEIGLPGGNDFYCSRALVAVDADLDLPVRAQLFDGADRLLADYAYEDLRLNPGFTPLDFDSANPEYGFPRWRIER